MSAPSLACDLLDAIGPLLKSASTSLGCKVRLDYYPGNHDFDPFWCIVLHDENGAYQGIDHHSPSGALLKANSDRQSFDEAQAKAAAA